jgi:hypothetical protein
MKDIFGDFISYWEAGEVVTSAWLHPETGEVEAETVDVGEMGALLSEEFLAENGNTFRICPTCHSFVLTTKMVEGTGKVLEEVEFCMDKDCESNG